MLAYTSWKVNEVAACENILRRVMITKITGECPRRVYSYGNFIRHPVRSGKGTEKEQCCTVICASKYRECINFYGCQHYYRLEQLYNASIVKKVSNKKTLINSANEKVVRLPSFTTRKHLIFVLSSPPNKQSFQLWRSYFIFAKWETRKAAKEDNPIRAIIIAQFILQNFKIHVKRKKRISIHQNILRN